jgi:formylglycine-generating enzyme required for sulfatase activity
MYMRRMAIAALLVLVSACVSTKEEPGAGAQPVQEFLPDGGPPVVNGFYEIQGRPCTKDCPDVLAVQPTALRKSAHPDAPIVATTGRHEWLSWIGEINRMRPVRGVVPKSMQQRDYDGKTIDFTAGEIVYLIDGRAYDDVPDQALWLRGATIRQRVPGFEQGDEVSLIVDWQTRSEEQEKADVAAGAGWWAQVRRDNGQTGYVLLQNLDCWSGGKNEEFCVGGRNSPAPPPPRDCVAQDISAECIAQRSAAAPREMAARKLKPFRDCPECPSMVWIPAQRFAAGQFEVTFAEWDACLAAGGCNGYRPSDRGWGRGLRPVINVKWADAQAYVQWLSQRTGKRYRLLTTEEWTAAAFPGGRRTNFSWGNTEPGCTPGSRNGAAYNICTPQQTLPVGTFQPNAFGLYDTIGNVGEWLQDTYAPGDQRYAIIGSSWASDLRSLGGRGGGTPDDLGADTGFRVARER